MSEQRLSGLSGIVFVIAQVVGVGLYFAAGAPPDPSNTAKFADYIGKNSSLFLVFGFLDGLSISVAFVFLVGLWWRIRRAGEQHAWAAMLVFGAGLVSGLIAILGAGLLAAAALDTAAKTESTAVRALYEAGTATFLLGAFPTALFLAAAAYAVGRTAVLPAWTAWVGWFAAATNAASGLAIFGGTNPDNFFAANGLAGLVLGLVPFLLWFVVTSLAMLARQTEARPAPHAAMAR